VICCRLSGISPFYCESSSRDTLMRVRDGKWSFDAEAFAEISSEAKDFISKLLEKDPKCVTQRSPALTTLFCSVDVRAW